MDSRFKTFLLAAALFLLNLYICHELFGIEYLRHMESIEGAYIGISRYAIEHWRDLAWFPLWYGGIPYQNAYPPLLHLGVALVAVIRGISPALAYHWTIAWAYCLGPITLAALVLRFTRSPWSAFAAGMFYSTLSISAWLMPSVRNDMGNVFYPRRFQALAAYGEGPHVSALTLLPLALLLIDWAIARRRPLPFVMATLMMTAAAVTNWLAAFAFALMIAAWLLARLGAKRWRGDFLLSALMAIAAYCLAMPWIPPSTIAVTEFNAQSVAGDYHGVYRALPVWGVAALASLALLKWLTRRLERPLQFAIFFAFLVSLPPLVHEWLHIAIVPQPERYHLEMEMGFAILFALVAHSVFRNRPPRIAGVAIALMLLAMIQPIRGHRNFARNFLLRSIDITTTSEWKNADWLNHHWTGQRVLLSGSDGFWLTAFSDTPEITGGFDQGRVNSTIPGALYGITTGEAMGEHDAEYSVLWLKAFGVQAVGVSGPGSTEFYKPFHNPKKFDGVLEPLWREGGDVIYRVSPPASLARIVPRSSLVKDPPYNALDVAETKLYVAALDDRSMPRADFHWLTQHSAHIDADLSPDQAVSIQISDHRGWHARANGRSIPIGKDGLGFMYLDPHIAGPASIEIDYDGGFEMRLAHWLSALAALALAAPVLADAAAHAMLKRSW